MSKSEKRLSYLDVVRKKPPRDIEWDLIPYSFNCEELDKWIEEQRELLRRKGYLRYVDAMYLRPDGTEED